MKKDEMAKFFYPSSIVIFGVTDTPGNLAKNIILNCQAGGFVGKIYPVGRKPGSVSGYEIITDPESLPMDIDLAVILIPAKVIPETMKLCGKKGIRHVIIESAGFREFGGNGDQIERDVQAIADKYGIRFIGPNCIGVVCTNSGLCTPFNPFQAQSFKNGDISLISQSGGIATQAAHTFSEEHVGFSKIISAGNKLDIDEIDLLQYLMSDDDTRQIYMYLESIEDGRALVELARKSEKPVVLLKSNVGQAASSVAKSHTAALSNNDRIVDGAAKQAGIVRVDDLYDMTICARALSLPALKGNRLVAISPSGGFAIILGDLCEKYGFECPKLPRQLLDKIEDQRRGGVIRMTNPMDFGDVYDMEVLVNTIESCLRLDDIDGIVLSYMYNKDLLKAFNGNIGSPERILEVIKDICERTGKPVALSFHTEQRYIEEFRKIGTFPVFNDPAESVRALQMLRNYWRVKESDDRF
jgi:acetyltransferase